MSSSANRLSGRLSLQKVQTEPEADEEVKAEVEATLKEGEEEEATTTVVDVAGPPKEQEEKEIQKVCYW